MITFVALFVSGDRGRSMVQTIKAHDVDDAASKAVYIVNSEQFGKGASWFVGGVWQEDVAAHLEAVLVGVAT